MLFPTSQYLTDTQYHPLQDCMGAHLQQLKTPFWWLSVGKWTQPQYHKLSIWKVYAVTKPDGYLIPHMGDCISHIQSAKFTIKLAPLKCFRQGLLTARIRKSQLLFHHEAVFLFCHSFCTQKYSHNVSVPHEQGFGCYGLWWHVGNSCSGSDCNVWVVEKCKYNNQLSQMWVC